VVLLGVFGWFSWPETATGTTIRSLAVLPLSNLSGESSEMYFVDGMHGALIAEVSKISALSVISRTSVLRYRETAEDISAIARELDVDAVLEGTVFRSGDSVRITANLIAGDPERNLLTLSYDRGIRDVLALHADVAREIAGAIEAELSPDEEQRLLTIHQIAPEVLDVFLRGRFEHSKATQDGFARAIQHYEQVIAEEPNFAPAHAALALSVHLLGVYGGRPTSETEPRAKAAALRALELGGDLAEARAVLGGVAAMYDWDWEAAEAEYRVALEIDQSSSAARQWYAYHLSAMGRHEDAIAQARLGMQFDPLNPTGRLVLADQLMISRDYGQARAELQLALESNSDLDRARELLETISTLEGKYEEAVEIASERIRLTNPPDASTLRSDLERSFERDGPRGYWAWRLARLEAQLDARYVAPTEFAVAHVGLGNFDAAFDWLNRAYEAREGMELLNVAPWYDPLRGDPRAAGRSSIRRSREQSGIPGVSSTH
jgi:TolB-like protein/Tfp pilus assembly protein PilF